MKSYFMPKDTFAVDVMVLSYLYHADHHQERIRKVDKDFARELEFKNKFSSQNQRYSKIEKKNSIKILGEGDKMYYILIEYFNTFMYDYILHHGRKHFCHYYLQTFSIEKILNCHLKDCLKSNGKQMIKIPKKSEQIRFKNNDRKMIINRKIIYSDFESILVP